MLQVFFFLGILLLLACLGMVGAFILPVIFIGGPMLALTICVGYLLFKMLDFSPRVSSQPMEQRKDFARTLTVHSPTVLIIDDDVDSAIMTASILQRQGCHIEISTGQDGSDNKLALEKYDFVLLDWMLGKNLWGHNIIEGANKIIDRRGDLREKFRQAKQKVITYSVLDSNALDMPDSQYFEHYDHWQKPLRYSDLAFKTTQLLMSV